MQVLEIGSVARAAELGGIHGRLDLDDIGTPSRPVAARRSGPSAPASGRARATPLSALLARGGMDPSAASCVSGSTDCWAGDVMFSPRGTLGKTDV